MLFNQIAGYKSIKQQLIAAVHKQMLGHTQIFYAQEGCGALLLAIAYAQYIACTKKQPTDACNACANCKQYNQLSHPDLHLVFPTVKTGKAKKPLSDGAIELFREQLQTQPYFTLSNWLECLEAENSQGVIYTEESEVILRKLSLKPYSNALNTVIIWLPETMHLACANKLLKIIEEPPAETLFLLATENLELILPTIRSRSQITVFEPLAVADMVCFATTELQINAETAEWAANLANGNMVQMLTLTANTNAEEECFELFKQLMRSAYAFKATALLAWADTMATFGRDKQKQLLHYYLQQLRKNLLFNLDSSDANLIVLTANEQVFADKFAPYLTFNRAHKIVAQLNLAYEHIAANVNARLVFSDLGLQIAQIFKQPQV